MLEDIKRAAEVATGLYRPKAEELPALVLPPKPNTFRFDDDGETPNNPKFPLLIYHSAVLLEPSLDPAAIFEDLFAANGWQNSWRDSIYEFLHFHTSTHEVLGIARGHASVEFGGNKGGTFNVKAGDVIVLPAGTGHSRNSASDDFLVVGAYPAEGRYDEPKPGELDHAKAVELVSYVRAPTTDPVYGVNGPLLELWHD